jgi:hypothetical protein
METTFYKDRAVANRLEAYVVALLNKQEGQKAWLNPAPESDRAGRRECDLFCENATGLHRIELKSDFRSIESGRVAIEQKALQHSGADHFFFILPELYAISTKELMELEKANRFHSWNAGDQSVNPNTFIQKPRFIAACEHLTKAP